MEKTQPKRRIVRVWHPEAKTDMWYGEHGNAPVEVGYVAYQWNNGEVIEG